MKFGFSDAMKSHAARSASALDAVYTGGKAVMVETAA